MTENVSERVSDEQLATVAEQDGDEWVRMIAQAGLAARDTIASLQAELESVKGRNVALERVARAAQEFVKAHYPDHACTDGEYDETWRRLEATVMDSVKEKK